MIEQGNGNGYHYVFKRVHMSMAHCPRCNETMTGNGSMVMPYRCKCGEWQYDYSLSAYTIKTLSGEILK